jgi:hypothetical protein
MALAAGLVSESIENTECRRSQAEREPHRGGRLLVGERQRSDQKFLDGGLFSRLGFEADQQCDFDHGCSPHWRVWGVSV